MELRYQPRSEAESAEALAAELAERLDSDLERGFTGHGPHRDDLGFRREGRELRSYGSRGQQRLGLLALLLAEREELAAERGAAPLLLLDDVMSELDATRRERLTDLLRRDGQAVITTTELDHVPGGGGGRRDADRDRGRRVGDDSPEARVAGGSPGVEEAARGAEARPVSFALDALADDARAADAAGGHPARAGRRPPASFASARSPSPSATACSPWRATARSWRRSST